VHPIAERGFGETVDAYRRSRPTYPPASVVWLAAALRIGPGATVVDVGAGTGKLTALLEPRGPTLLAVEPLESMRQAMADELPGVAVVEGLAEALPLADASVDAVVVGQAFHWFDLSRALPEFHRVLRPGGSLGVIWNELDTSRDWVADLDAIIAVPRTGTPHPSAARTADLGGWFDRRRLHKFAHSHLHDRASLLDRVGSMSFIAVLPEPKRDSVLASVAALVDSRPELDANAFELPYVTVGFTARRSGHRGPR